MEIKRIAVLEAREQLAREPGMQVVDMRDEQSYLAGHIEAAQHLHGANMQEFLGSADPDKPVLVYCYHGHMSQALAAYLVDQGFDAYSLDGGYAAWQED